MNKLKFFSFIMFIIISLSGYQVSYSQMKFNAGMFYCNFNGDTLSFDLKTDLNDLYFMTMGGTADFGLIKIQWDDVKNPPDIKVQTLELEKGFVQDTKTK